MNKKGFSAVEIIVYLVIALVLFVLVILFLTGTVSGAGKQALGTTESTNISCIATQTINDCGVCQQACCHCPANCKKADENIKYGEGCSD